MRKMRITSTLTLSFLLLFSIANAQDTFDEVYSILQANCASSGCHGGASPVAFDLGSSKTATYNALINVTPLNPAAAAKGNLLVDPGHPYNSFLLRKIGDTYDPYFDLEVAEGNEMPTSGAPALDDYEIELIRQWILDGADITGTAIDTAMLHEYINIGGIGDMTPPVAPAAGQGFQLRMGPVFLDKNGTEIEYLKKERLYLPDDVEVTKLEGIMNSQSHHFLLFQFDSPTASNQYDDGLRVVSILNTATDGAKELTSAWQYNTAFELPTGTAFYWDKNDVLDMNYHIKNYSNDSILPCPTNCLFFHCL